MRTTLSIALPIAAFVALAALSPSRAHAHCDGLDGPVVTSAREALRTRDVSLALVWVQPPAEAEVRTAFTRTLAVRRLNAAARDLADTFFFETLVRLHRAGEGAPYTGLKPAGRDLGPAIPAADRALATGDPNALVRLLTDAIADGAREHFQRAMSLRRYPSSDLAAGRRYIEAYVVFIHYVEGLYVAAHGAADGHAAEVAHGAHHEPGEE